jgi:transcriptional regulator with XRE-family HTH domain
MAQIAKNIKKQRVSSGMTQEELAKRLYVTRQTISNYENGKSNPDIETLRQMAQVLDTDMELFLYGEQKPKDKKEIIKTAVILGAILLFTLITPVIVKNEREWIVRTFRTPWFSFSFFMHVVGFSVLLVVAGIYVTKFVVLLTGGQSLRFSNRIMIHRIILFLLIGYVVLLLPLASSVQPKFFCCEILDSIQSSIVIFFLRFPGVYAVFFIIGCLLYLTASRKATPKDKTSAKTRSENKTPA